MTPGQRKQKKLEDTAAAALAVQKAKNKLKAGISKQGEDGKTTGRKVDEERLARLSQPKPVKQAPPSQ